MARTIEPLNVRSFGLAQHSFQVHQATVEANTSKKDLEDPGYWANVKARLKTHDEIRIVAEDSSFYAIGFVAHVDGYSAQIRVVLMTNVDVSVEENPDTDGRFQIKQRGQLKWCVVDTTTDKNIKTGIGKRSDAYRELEEYQRALAA